MSDQGDWDDDDPGWRDGGDEYEDAFDDPERAEPDGERRNLSWLVAAAIILLVAVGVGAALVASGDDDDGGDDTAEVDGSSTTTTRRLGLPGLPGSSTTTSTPASSTTSSTTSTTGPGGVTSSTSTTVPDGPKEPACAPLVGGGAATPVADGWQSRWTTKPAPNDPASLSFCVDDRTPKVGQVVTLTAHAADPDAPIADDECAVFVSWDGDGGNLCYDVLTPGVKPTPPEQKGDVVAKRTFVYRGDQVGARRISVTTTSGGGPDRSPYTSSATTSLEITVHA